MSKESLSLVVAVARAHSCLFNAIEKSIQVHGLNLSEFGVLEYLLHKGDQPVQKIAEKILVTSGTITYVIDKLQKKGYVVRKQCDKDKRIYYVSLTPAGRTLIEEVFQAHETDLDSLLNDMTSSEKTALIDGLKRMQHVIKKSD